MKLNIIAIFCVAALSMTACATGEDDACISYCRNSNLLMSCTEDGGKLVNCPNGCVDGACVGGQVTPSEPGTPSGNACSHLGQACVGGELVTCVAGNITERQPCANGCVEGSKACNTSPSDPPSGSTCSHQGQAYVGGKLVTCISGNITESLPCANGCTEGATACNTTPDPGTPDADCQHGGEMCINGALVMCVSGKITSRIPCTNGCAEGSRSCNAAPECTHQGQVCVNGALVTCASGKITGTIACANGCANGATSCNAAPEPADPVLPTVGASCDYKIFENVCQKGQFFYCKDSKVASFACSSNQITCAQFSGKDDCVYILESSAKAGDIYTHNETCSFYADLAAQYNGRNPADFIVATKADDGKIYGVETVDMAFCDGNYSVYCYNGEKREIECGISCNYQPKDDQYYGKATCTTPSSNQACTSAQIAACKKKDAQYPLCYIDKAYGEVNCTNACDAVASGSICADLDSGSASVNYACENIGGTLMETFDYSTYKKCSSTCNSSGTACK